MTFTNETTVRAAEDFKEQLHLLMERHGVRDKEVAAILGVSNMCISRWKNETEESNLPAFALRMLLKSGNYSALARDLLNYVVGDKKYMVVRRLHGQELNGSLHEELLLGMESLGELAKNEDIDPAKIALIRQYANAFLEAGYAMIDEIETKEATNGN